MSDTKLIMKFIDESQNFTYGFECGIIWERMERSGEFINHAFHAENKQQIEMMCKRFGYEYSMIDYALGWCLLTATINPTINN